MTNNEKNNQQGRDIGSGSRNIPEKDQGKKTEKEDFDKAKDIGRDRDSTV